MTPPDYLPRLVDCARAAAAAGHGDKAQVYAQCCRDLGWLRPDGAPALQRLYRALGRAGLCTGHVPRKSRADAGAHSLPLTEAQEIVRWQRENARKGGQKTMVTLADAVNVLRANGIIRAERIDGESGECTPLSLTAIAAAIRAYGLSKAVLDTPPPAMRMRVLHANHVWQVDASLCVLYHLPKDGGLQVMREAVFNSNKPKNIAKIENERVWRYVVTDVASGAIYVEYVFGGESGANLTHIFINAMQQRKGEFWGVPKRVYCDAGSANTGAVFKGLCAQLGIDLQWHMPENARATGAVEKCQDIIEVKFESMLASRRVYSLEQLNAAAAQWRVRFGATAVHTRHGMTRLNAWSQHVRGHLVQAPTVEVCRALAHTKPITRTVTPHLTVELNGEDWDVSAYPGVYRGLKVQVALNPWSQDSVRIVDVRDGHYQFHVAPLKLRNDLGYWDDSPVMGEEFKSHAQTAPEKSLAELAARTAADHAEQAQRDAANGVRAKKVKPLPFGGKVDPFKPLADAYIPTHLPVRADSVHAASAGLSLPPLTIAEACKLAKAQLGEAYPSDFYSRCAATHPGGAVPQAWLEAHISAVQDQAAAAAARPVLRVINGGGAP